MRQATGTPNKVAGRATELGNEQIVDLNTAIGFYNAVVRVLATPRIDVKAQSMPYQERFRLPD